MASIVIALIIAFFIPLRSEAQVVVDGEQMAYEFVQRTCQNPMDAFNEIYSEATMKNFDAAGRLYFFDVSGVRGMISRNGIESRAKFILESDALHRSLRECFGDNQDRKNKYVLHLIAANTAALFAGTVAGVGAPLKVLNWGFKFVQRFGWNAAMQKLVSRGLISDLTATRLGYVAAGTVVTALVAPPLIEANDKRLENNRRMRAEFEKDRAYFSELVQERATLTQSAQDQAYLIELNAEISAIGRKLLSNPAGSESELTEVKRTATL